MALSAPLKAAALVLFLAALAGATYGVGEVVGSTVESQLVTLTPAHAERNASAGFAVTYLFGVGNRDTAARDVLVRVEGVASGESAVVTVLGNATAGAFVTLDVPAGTPPGEYALAVSVVGEDGRVLRERPGMLTLNVLAPGLGFASGDTASAHYLGRLSATGRVFNTNDPAAIEVPFPRTDSYRFSQGELRIQTLPRPTIVEGLYQGMLGMQPGESRTITFGPELGYGPATQEERFPRVETLERDLTVPNEVQRVARATFDTYVEDSGQGRASEFGVGDTFTLEQNGNRWPYRIVDLSESVVAYRLAAQVGATFTIFPFWPDASVVTAIDDESVTFRTTPTTEVGGSLTMKAHWPQMTTLDAVNDTAIVVRHSPPAGYTYTTVSSMGQPREATITKVDDEVILAASPSSNPLAGKDLTFDVTLLALER